MNTYKLSVKEASLLKIFVDGSDGLEMDITCLLRALSSARSTFS
jgi:hypothetical protein